MMTRLGSMGQRADARTHPERGRAGFRRLVGRIGDRRKPRPVTPLTPAVEARIDEPVRDYWRARLAQTAYDSYLGVPLFKMPEDLRTYEHLIWRDRSECVIEVGGLAGGSALWFRDRLRAIASLHLIEEPRVISIDLDISAARDRLAAIDPRFAETIKLLEGDVLDPELPSRVGELVPPRSRCLIVEDSAHTYDTTKAALSGFSQFVQPGGFFVVEDGVVDIEELRIASDWPRGVSRAIADWLSTDDGSGFEVRADLEMYGLSCHVGGYLQRTS